MIKVSDGELEGCHETKERAEAQRRALEASEGASMAVQPEPEPELVAIENSPNIRAALDKTAAEFLDALDADPTPLRARTAWENAVQRHLRPALAVEAAAETVAVARASDLSERSVPVGAVAEVADEHLQGLVDYGELIEAVGLRAPAQGKDALATMRALVGPDRLSVVVDRTVRHLRNGVVTLVLSGAGPAAILAVAASPFDRTKRWNTIGDDRVRATHAATPTSEPPGPNGEIVPVAAVFLVDGRPARYPGDPKLPIGLRINCFTADQKVSVRGLRRVFRMPYQGALVVLETAGGQKITGSPNHPVATPSGWRPLGQLHEGDDLVCRLLGDAVLGSLGPQVDEVEIGDLYAAAADDVGSVGSLGLSVDFHGDRPAGEVDVVTVDGELWDRIEAALAEKAQETTLAGSQVGEPILSSLGSGHLDLPAVGHATSGGVRGGHLTAAGGALHRGPLEQLSLGPTSTGDAVAVEEVHDGLPGNLVVLGEAEDGLPGQVTLDEVASVRVVEDWSGHLFTVETEAGWFTADSIKVGNCRCFLTPGDARPGWIARVRANKAAALAAAADVAATGTTAEIVASVMGPAAAAEGALSAAAASRRIRRAIEAASLEAELAAQEALDGAVDAVRSGVKPSLAAARAGLAQRGRVASAAQAAGEEISAAAALDATEAAATLGQPAGLASTDPTSIAGDVRTLLVRLFPIVAVAAVILALRGDDDGFTAGGGDRRTIGGVTDTASRYDTGPVTAKLRPEFQHAGPDHSSGVMLALVPDEETAQRLAAAGGLPVDELHLTLAYFGAAEDLDGGARDQLGEILRYAAQVVDGPIVGEVTTLTVFEANDERPFVALVDAPGLADYRHAVVGEARNAMGSDNQPFTDHDFTPHMTLGYDPTAEETEELMEGRVGGPLRFDRVQLDFGGEVLDLTLGEHPDATRETAVKPSPSESGTVSEVPVPAWFNEDDVSAKSGVSTPPLKIDVANTELREDGVYVDGEKVIEFDTVLTDDDGNQVGGALEHDDERRSNEERAAAGDFAWEAVLVIEGRESGDRRLIAEGALTWRTPPGETLPLMVMLQNPETGGHALAVPAGSIWELERVENAIVGRGFFDSGHGGQELRRMIEEGTIRGISADLDMMQAELVDDGQPDPLFLVTEARVMGATGTAFPAFEEAFIRLIEVDGAEAAAIVASGGTLWRLDDALWSTQASLDVAQSQALTVVGERDLPIADRERDWDGGAAAGRMQDLCRNEAGELDPDCFSRGFFFRDADEDPTNVTAYKFPFADVVNGRLQAVFAGVAAAAQRLDASDIPAADKDGIRGAVNGYYERFRTAFEDPSLRSPFEEDE